MTRTWRLLKRRLPYGVKALIKSALPKTIRQRYDSTQQWNSIKEEGSLPRILDLLNDMVATEGGIYWKSLHAHSEEVVTEIPGVAVIEINDSCNLDCAMCRTSLAARSKGLMDIDLFKRTIEGIRSRGTRRVSLHTIGDPLANRNIGTYLEVLREHSMTVPRFSTNALMLDRHMDTVFEYRDVIEKVRPSVDAASKDVYERIRIGGDWAALHRNLIAFSERNATADNPFPVSVDSIVSKDNFHEIAFIPYVFGYLAPPHKFGFNPINSLAPDGNAYFLKASYFDDHLAHHPCSFPWQYLGILKDGRFTACHRDYNGDLAFGDSTRDDPLKVYNDEFMRGLRRAHLNGDLESMPAMCRKCMTVDPRLGDLLTATIHHFYLNVRKHPAYLQAALDKLGPALNRKDYPEAAAVVRAL